MLVRDLIKAVKEGQEKSMRKSEPVGRISRNCDGILRQEIMLYTDKPLPIGTAVYLSSQPNKWVDMTLGDLDDIIQKSNDKFEAVIAAIKKMESLNK